MTFIVSVKFFTILCKTFFFVTSVTPEQKVSLIKSQMLMINHKMIISYNGFPVIFSGFYWQQLQKAQLCLGLHSQWLYKGAIEVAPVAC